MLIATYKKSWIDDFESIQRAIVSANDHLDIRLEHVGSTSIPDLMAKPIIDIDLIYSSKQEFEHVKTKLEAIGYHHTGDQGIPGREVFKRYDKISHPILDKIPHHLYVCHEENNELKRHLQFRDRLRENRSLRQQYQELKLSLARQANQHKKIYAQLKEKLAREFIESVIKEHE